MTQDDVETQPTGQEGGRPQEAPAETGEAFVSGLRQIQRILVEPRARQLQSALDALDRQRRTDLAEVRKELDRSISRSDDFIKKESSLLNERLIEERRERTRALEDRARELEGRLRALEERVGKLEEQLASETGALRQLSLDQYRQYTEELRGWREEMAKAIACELAGLRAEKADRSFLAHLLSEVGARLSGAAAEPVTH